MKGTRLGLSWIIGLALLTLLAASALFWYSRTNSSSPGDQVLRVGYQNSPAMALIMIAESQGYFSKPGTKIELNEFTAGKFALQAFLSQSVDVAVVGDVPIGLALLQNQKLKVVGEVLKDAINEVRMIVRQDGGCKGIKPEQYFGETRRKIATSFGGGPILYHNLFKGP